MSTKVRVVRILEYTYDSVEVMVKDMGHWQLGQNSTHRPRPGLTIRSATLPLEVLHGADRTDTGVEGTSEGGETETPSDG